MAHSTAARRKRSRPRLRKVNLRLLWIMIALSLAVMIGATLLHRYQMQQFGDVWRQEMRGALQRGDISEAIQACTRYLTLYPNDTETLTELAILLDENAASGSMLMRAYMTFERVLREDPARDNVRLRLADVAIKLRRYSDALVHLEDLRGQSADDPNLSYQKAICHEGIGQFREAAQLYSECVEASDAKIEYFTRLAGLILRHPGELDLKLVDPLNRDGATAGKVAAQIMDDAVETCRPQYRAYLARADFRQSQADLDGAEQDINAALELAEDNTDVLLAAAQLALTRADMAASSGDAANAGQYRDTASKYARRGIGRDLRLYVILARVLVDTGKRVEAITLLREAIAKLPAAREQATGDDIVRTLITERQLLFSLADELITQAETDAAGSGEERFREPRNLLNSLKKLSLTEPLVAFLEARLFAENADWQNAARAFEQARLGPHQLFDLTRRIDLQLSACYRALENPGLRILTLRRAVIADPLWFGGRVEFATALTDAGYLAEAIDEYRSLIQVSGVPLMLARLLTLQQVARSADVRDWTEVDQMLELARQTTPESPEIPVLEAEVLTQQQDFERAVAVLEEARSRFPDVVAIPVAQSLLALRRADAEQPARVDSALKILDEATMTLGRNVELDLAGAEVAIQISDADGRQLLQNIPTAADYDEETMVRLYQGLARAAGQMQAPQLALGFWKKVVDLRPADLRAHLQIASLSRSDPATWTSALAAIRRIEGPEGPNGNFEEAVTLIERVPADALPLTANSAQMKNLSTARRLLAEAAIQRPQWAAVPRAQGKLEAISGNADAAFDYFRTALELGDRSRDLVMQVVQGYMQRKRFDEADQELKKLSENQPELISGDLARMAWAVAFRRDQVDRAIELADRVADNSEDFRDQIWLSELRFARGQRGVDVEEPLEEAIRRAPTAPEPWFAKVAYLTRIGRIDAAEAVIQLASSSIREDAVSATVARCYELISEFSTTEKRYLAEAEKYYLQGLESRPDGDVSRIIMIADFYIRHAEFQKAEAYLQQLLAPQTAAPDFALAWARRRQAMLIASRGGYDDTARALKMLEQNELLGTEVAAADLRAHAEILSRRPFRSDRLAAIKILEQLEQRQELETTDAFRLAILNDETGNWPNARRVMLDNLLTAETLDPAHVAFFVQRLIRHDQVNEAQPWMNKLEELQPSAFRTVFTKAKLLGAVNRSAEAVPLLTGFLQDRRQALLGLPELLEQQNANDAMEVMRTWLVDAANPQAARILRQVRELLQQQQTAEAVALLREHVNPDDLGDATHAAMLRVAADLLEGMGELQAAEDFFRQYASLSTQQEAAFILAKFLARNGRVDEALAVCEQHLETGTPDLIAAATASVVSHGNTTAEQLQRVDAWILSTVERQPDSLVCRIALADLRLLQRRFDEAEQLYRLILSRDDRHLVALNNLAWLLAHTRQNSAQALEVINRALKTAGHHAALLDTRAMVYLSSGKTNQAVKDLQEAFVGSDSAIGYLHLALAYLQTEDHEAAAAAMTEAQHLGLRANGLHPLEREKFDKVQQALAEHSG